MRRINIKIDGRTYVVVSKGGKSELGIKGNTTPEKDESPHEIDIPNILIITRRNADVLFILKGDEKDSFKIITAQELYNKFQYQWFEPLADNYRELLYVNDADYVMSAYKIYTWDSIAKFSLVKRPLLSYRAEGSGDWKNLSDGGDGFLLSLIDNIPYWSDAIGQIPFAVGTYRAFHSIKATIDAGMVWATGKPLDALMQKTDSTTEYDNFFVLRGALYASKKFSYSAKTNGGNYPAVDIVESSVDVSAKILGKSITKEELEQYGIWNQK
ncbi:Uncharacterised protein [Raoultella terrigena]|uniref:Uncharacterized protein n=1 Tax=Raoultella terrigena TaxID=577 RepID=A0A3P8JTB0_RAOTE|nr:Uncharacterised protein [Raoultella terrigena]